MRIKTFDFTSEQPQLCGLEEALQRRIVSSDRLAAARWSKLLELARVLKEDGPYPEVWSCLLCDVLHMGPSNSANRVSVDIWMDWQDYGPVSDGLPVLHYRLQIRRGTAPRSTDARADRPEKARDLILQAFGWSNS